MYKTTKYGNNVYITILWEVHMNTSNMKKMIVLKDLPSNIVEEAIVVLKSNINIKNYEFVDKDINNKGKTKEKNGNYIVKEAENLVSNYISNIEKPKNIENKNIQLQKKYNRLKKICLFWTVMSILGILINII